MKTIQTIAANTTSDTFQTIEPARLGSVQGGIGGLVKLLAKGASKAKQAWPSVKDGAAKGAKFVGASAAAAAIGDVTVKGYNWAYDKATGGR